MKFKYDLDLRAKKAPHTPAPMQVPVLDPAMARAFWPGMYTSLGVQKPPCLNPVVQRTPPRRSSPTPMTSSPPYIQEATGEYGIDGFLEFVPFDPHKKQQIRDILINLEIYDFRLINEVDLEIEGLLLKGLKAATVKALYRGAVKYRHEVDRSRKRLRLL